METELTTCKNCDHQFTGKFCSNCGQSVKELERPIRFMIADFMGTIITFDTRLVKTLVTILFKPGYLTIDYLAGKRARYMPPFRFYLFISFVMFLLMSLVTNKSIKDNYDSSKEDFKVVKNEMVAVADSVQNSNDSIYVATRETIKAELDSAAIDSTDIDDIDTFISSMEDLAEDVENGDSKYSKTIKMIESYPELYINKLYQFTSWSLFLFMPIFAFLLWISFFRTKKLYIGHLIFALNIHSFIFTITAIVIAVNLIFKNHSTGWIGYLYFLVPIYQVVGARRIYKRKWINAFFKMTLIWMMYGFVWLIGLIIIAALSFVGLN
jgi:rRNA maturation protein Nop10